MKEIIKIQAPAKVNFYLKVVRRRPDGYHDLVSFMQALELADMLTLEKAEKGVEIACDRPDVPAGGENIVFRAAETVLRELGVTAGVRITLEKKIPMAAGLGGGSSDAAAAIKGLMLLYGLAIPKGRLMEIALSLGADVPFFLSWPSALARGVGEDLSELPSPAETWLALVNPGFAVPTKWVYSNLNLGLTNNANNITLPPFKAQAADCRRLASYLHNDLERVTVGKYPKIKDIKERLYGFGAIGALMSGSGPTVFGIFESRSAAENAAALMAEPGWVSLATRTVRSWPEPVVSAV